MKTGDLRIGLLLALLGTMPVMGLAVEPAPGEPGAPAAYNAEEKADDEAEPEDGEKRLFDWSGYLNAGYFGNTHGSHYNGNVNSGSQNIGGVDGVYLAVSKSAATSDCGIDWGAGVDFMFGEDSRFMRVQNGLDETWVTGHDGYGNATYGFAMPQLYGEMSIHHLSVRAGHFYTPFGYEGAKASDRFFYSRGLSFDNLPVTHTGVWATYDALKNIAMSIGWVNGIDQGFSSEAGGSLVAGQLAWTISEKVSLKYTFGAGDVQDRILDDRTKHQVSGDLHTWVLELKPDECWDLVTTADYSDMTISDDIDYTSTVLGQHLYRKINDCWKLGTRVEWQGIKYADMAARQERFSLAFGANWSPNASEHFKVRPEIRYDSDSWDPYGRHEDKGDQLCLGMDLLYVH